MSEQPPIMKAPTDGRRKPVEVVEQATVRFAGDSGDGVQLAGAQFTTTTAIFGNDLATLPDYPAEIRAPASSLAGVSGFQISFSSNEIYTPGDVIQTLVVMNAAALKVNIADLEEGGILIANTDGFARSNLRLAGCATNPLEDGSLSKYRVFAIPIATLAEQAVEATGLTHREAERCKNFYALGLVCWLYERALEPTLAWLRAKFGDKPVLLKASELALHAGFNYGETTDSLPAQFHVDPAKLRPGRYRKIRGNEATALGMIAAAHKAGKQLYYASYPITPASDILHELARHESIGVKVFQAEDEIAAMCSVVGAAYGGAFAATGTSGPGLDLKTEAIGLAVMLELPCVIVDVQRGGPCTGLPTKTEQADLLQVYGGRHGECPVPIIAPQLPSDCFNAVYEAFQIAVKYMTPVFVLSDAYLANGAEPWRIPLVEELPPFNIRHDYPVQDFQPYSRDENLARPWAVPGTPGLAHRVGGLEKEHLTGAVSYTPENHQQMVNLRAAKIAKVVESIPDLEVLGDRSGELLVVSWGSAYGEVLTAVQQARREGLPVSHVHLRWLRPMARNLGTILKNFRKVLVPEMNLGHLAKLIRADYLVDARSFNKVEGKPFAVAEILGAIRKVLKED
jgi:2-oxoglutarate/2-oxoacid ferredoxin oxidoreductase subunit alpha